jgi:hypothetical protein
VSDAWRNVLIVLALAAAAYFVPGGGDTASFIGAVLSIGITLAIVLIAARLYREYRTEIYSLGDTHRALLYGAVGIAVLAMAGIGQLFDSGPGIMAWFLMIGAASFALAAVWRRYRSYD